jgi:hypothetical protein
MGSQRSVFQISGHHGHGLFGSRLSRYYLWVKVPSGFSGGCPSEHVKRPGVAVEDTKSGQSDAELRLRRILVVRVVVRKNGGQTDSSYKPGLITSPQTQPKNGRFTVSQSRRRSSPQRSANNEQATSDGIRHQNNLHPPSTFNISSGPVFQVHQQL